MTPQEIARLRGRLKLSQGQFAQLLGVHSVTVSRWERGDAIATPSPYHLALMKEFEKAAASKEAQRIGDTLDAVLVGAGVAAALWLLLQAARAK